MPTGWPPDGLRVASRWLWVASPPSRPLDVRGWMLVVGCFGPAPLRYALFSSICQSSPVCHTPGFFCVCRLLESKIRFIALSVGMVTVLSSERSGAERCPGSGPWPVPRVPATSPSPAWRPKPPTHRSLFLQPCTRPSRGPRRSLAIVPLIPNQRYYGECPASLPCISPPSIVGLAAVTEAPAPAPARQIVARAVPWPREGSSVIGIAVGAGCPSSSTPKESLVTRRKES